MAIIDYWNLPEDQKRGMDILIREGLYPPPLPPQPRGPGVPVFQPQGGSIPLPRNWDWTAMESEYSPFPQPPSQGSRPQARPIPKNQITFGDQRQNLSYSYPSPAGVSDDWWGKGIQAVGYDNPPSQGLRPQARPIPKNQITFGDQRLQTPDQFYRSIFPDWQDLSYQYPSPSGQSDDWWGRGQSVRPNQVTFGDQLPPPSGQYPSPVSGSDSWWGRGQSVRPGGPTPPIDPSPSPVVPRERAIVLYNPSQQAANAARTRQAYAAGMDDYFPGLKPPRKMPKPSDSTDWMNSGRGIAVQEGLGYGLGGLMSGGFALSAGATPSQALGIAGASVAGDAAGSFLGHLAGTAAIPLLGPIAPFAGRMIGGAIGGMVGDRVGWKATGAEADLNRRYEERYQPQYQMDGQPMYQMMPPTPPTPQERMRNEILLSAQNPYMPYMMAQLGGYYAR